MFKNKTKVILDTNFLIIPGELGIDVFSEIQRIMQEPYELYVLEKTEDELETLIIKLGKQKAAFNAKLGLILLKQKGLKTLRSSSDKYADDALVELGEKNPSGIVVATQDKSLKERLRKLSVRVIELKQKKYLAMR